MQAILVTGGAGFIGSNLVRYLLEHKPKSTVVNLDNLTYAGNLESLSDVKENPRYHFVRGDICDRETVDATLSRFGIDAIIHCAAESHVDRSILGAEIFVRTNVNGTLVLLEAAKGAGVRRFIHVSTDEVYGSLGPIGKFTESSPLHPNSPYAASKAGSDLLALAYQHTFGLPVIVTRCSNNYGPYQFPEKLIPLMIINAINDKPLPVYGDGKNVRDWLYVEDHCSAITAVLDKGAIGEVYNIGGENEWQNIDIVRRILSLLGKDEELIQFVKDRPGHDRRYAIDPSRIRDVLGWAPAHKFEEGLEQTVHWYLGRKDWWGRVMTGEYQTYYKVMYDER